MTARDDEIARLYRIAAAALELAANLGGCDYDRGWCFRHGQDRPCPVEQLRAALDADQADDSAGEAQRVTRPTGLALVARLEAAEAEARRQLKASDDELMAQGGWDAASEDARIRHLVRSTQFAVCAESLYRARQAVDA